MSSLLTLAPLEAEPLPLYSRHDPDNISLLSAAPSYVSDTPTYSSYRTPTSLLPPLLPNQQVIGLPAPHYAPGFQNRASGNLGDVSMRNFDPGSWSVGHGGNNSRQYNAVARRRANTARENGQTTALLNSLSAVPPSTSSGTSTPTPASLDRPGTSSNRISPTSSTTNISSPTSYPVHVGSSSDPLNPHEDPHLVGEEAAGRARAQRVYREMCLKGEETAKYESRSWDFMFGQMADWEDRRKSWKGFKKSVNGGGGRGFARRLAFRGR
ncbi:hypothetical protein P280DRAFT_105480 [Massarina eburnea CBS 473.64]|uniref:Uncharacterized protein n=1 Tax=Massarina eburnea CBS 473.64 TaxID=1395130 RepID=A0A6A6RSW3_9PLEO|nr:hypothetical protein P280DRAFT_105480 [Massarina eburnea CBS 473.64]